MLTIVLWLWHDPQCRTQYTPEHANIAARQIHRNLTLPHRFVLLTDKPKCQIQRKQCCGDCDLCERCEVELCMHTEEPFDPLIKPVKLWEDWKNVENPYWRAEFPQCYVRLKAFSPEMREILGPRFVSIDLDCVVTGNLDAILGRTEEFIICKRARVTKGDFYDHYQASMFMLTAGARAQVWSKFDGERSLQALNGKKHEKLYLKTDQGWILYVLGRDEATWGMEDGVYTWRWLAEHDLTERLPGNARIVFFNGQVKPWTMDNRPRWIEGNWR